jgi:hypothetical protein
MPHYPDEVEYSDKYMDDHYEYRHVILPKDVYRKMPRGRILTEHVLNKLFRNGDRSEFNSPEVGSTTSCINLSPIFSSSEDPKELTLPLVFLQLTSSPLPIHSSTDIHLPIYP